MQGRKAIRAARSTPAARLRYGFGRVVSVRGMTVRRRELVAGMAFLVGGSAAQPLASQAVGPVLDVVLARWDQDEYPGLRGVVVLVDGQRVAERYFNGERPDALHDMRSAGKSVTSLLVGAARDRGLIGDLSAPVQRYWPESRGTPVGDVTLADVLTMRSGLAANDELPESPGNEDRLDAALDPVAFLLATPRAAAPGTAYQYNSLTAYLAGLIVEKATGRQGQDFAREALFTPLGIEQFNWASDIAGHIKGQGNLSLTVRDMGTIGQMVLDRGQRFGRQVLSPGWIDASISPRVEIGAVDPYADGYGYFWYARALPVGNNTVDVRFASGNGGNKIYVIPSRRMVVSVTSSAYGRVYGQRRSQAILTALLEA